MSQNNPTNTDNSTRREFIKTGSAAVVGTALATGIARSAYAAGSEEIRVGLIGCGGRGGGAATQACSTEGPVKLVAMADAFRDRLEIKAKQLSRQLKDRFSVANDSKYDGFDGYKKIMDRKDIDLVILTTPPGFRPMHFEYAVNVGKNIFMEKPVATDPAGIRRVLAANVIAKKKGLQVGVGLQRHHQANYIETVNRIKDGAIGDPVTFRVYWNGGGVWTRGRAQLADILKRQPTEMEYQMRNWYYFNWLCGDHITEQHIHNLDVANWVMGGHPVTAQGQGGREVRKGKDAGQIFDHHFVEFTYENGAKMFSQCRHIRGCWNQVSEFVEGTKGKSQISSWVQKYGGEMVRSKGGKNPYQQEHDDLFDSIRNNKKHNEADYGATSTMTSIMGRMATYSGGAGFKDHMVTWDAAINSKVEVFPHDPNFKWAWDANPPVLPDANGNYPVPVPGQTKVV